ncbi:MAG: hypothetical protein INR69_05960 [Mucilaginibacter polytrichastri]|nr:hypothetical protein [Mucilaginibacter polytrichastri]
MNTRLIMTLSSLVFGLAGAVLIFAPDEVSVFLLRHDDVFERLFLQIAGGSYFAFAVLNSLVRGTWLGGIYGRPIVLANLAHCVIAGLPVIKAAFFTPHFLVYGAALTYLVFGVLFSLVLFTTPKTQSV